MAKRYTTILFDADDTLLDFKRSERTALQRVLHEYGLLASETVLSRYSAINAGLWRAFERGEVTKEELKRERYRRLFAEFKMGQDLDVGEVNDRYLALLGETGFRMDGAKELCEALKSAGYELDLITNGIPKTQRQRMENAGLLPFFANCFVSEAIGAQKPLPAFFEYVLSHIAERDPKRVLVVGDTLGSDILGAVQAGLDCVWFNPQFAPNDRGLAITYEVQSHAQLAKLLGVSLG